METGARERSDFDVCIIGGGPAGLAALSAMCEPYSIDRLGRHEVNRAPRAAPPKPPSVCVVDPRPWMSSWRERFANLEIGWLRSPAMAHPDAFDAWSLLEFAHTSGRRAELLKNDADSWKEIKTLGQAQAGLFDLPASDLFLDFCKALVSKLPHTFKLAKATSVTGSDDDFTVHLSEPDGCGANGAISAKVVVLALGAPGPPTVPAVFRGLPEDIAFHTDQGRRLRELRRGRRVLVIGGGLTAVQAAQSAMRRGCKVTLCSRRPLITKNFDIPLEWFDPRKQGRLRHNFWQLPMEERLKHLRAVKGGGSVPPWYMQQLRAAEAEGRVEVLCGEVETCAQLQDSVEVKLLGEHRRYHHVILACGHQPNCEALPVFSELQRSCPVPIIGGLPQLTKELQWGSHEQLYVVGAVGALQIGPDAGNLMGCRRAAETLTQNLGLRLWQRCGKQGSGSNSIRGNRFAALDDSDSESEDDETTDVESSGSPVGCEPDTVPTQSQSSSSDSCDD